MTAYAEIIRRPQQWQRLEAVRPGIVTVDFGTVVAPVVAFVDDEDTAYINGRFVVPKNIDTSGTVTFAAIVSPETGAADKYIVIYYAHVAIADGESLDASYSSDSSGILSVTATTGNTTSATWTKTVADLGWSVGDLIIDRVRRGHPFGDLAGDLYLLSFSIRIPLVEA